MGKPFFWVGVDYRQMFCYIKSPREEAYRERHVATWRVSHYPGFAQEIVLAVMGVTFLLTFANGMHGVPDFLSGSACQSHLFSERV